MKRLTELIPFAREHGLKIVSIEDLIAYRIARESFVTRVRAGELAIGDLTATVTVFGSPFDDVQHVAAVFGDIAEREAVPVRIHREQPVSDMFAPARGRRSWVEPALDVFRREGNGVLILLRSPLVDDVALDGRDEGGTHEEESHASAVARRRRWRDVGVGAQILRELGVRSIRAVATEERGYVGLTGFGIDIAETILIEP